MQLIEWLVPNFRDFGLSKNKKFNEKNISRISLLFSNCKFQGQCCEECLIKVKRGRSLLEVFGSVGGILRYKLEFQNFNVEDDNATADYCRFTCYWSEA